MPRRHNEPCGPGPNDPTPDEIRAFCRDLQENWTPREEAKRRGCYLDTTAWNVPECGSEAEEPV